MANPVCPIPTSGAVGQFLVGLLCFTFEEYGFYFTVGVTLAATGVAVTGDESGENYSLWAALSIAPVLFVLLAFVLIPFTGVVFDILRSVTPIPWTIELYRVASTILPVVFLVAIVAVATDELTGRIET